MGAIHPGVTDEEFRIAMKKVAEEEKVLRKTCTHKNYQGMQKHGRCCPDCGTFVVDFGD